MVVRTLKVLHRIWLIERVINLASLRLLFCVRVYKSNVASRYNISIYSLKVVVIDLSKYIYICIYKRKVAILVKAFDYYISSSVIEILELQKDKKIVLYILHIDKNEQNAKNLLKLYSCIWVIWFNNI